jgi:hypothetical protein
MKNNVLKNDVTKNESASERAVALVQEALDVLQRAEQAPDSPVNTFLTADMRRKYRRDAGRLREQRMQPRYNNLHSAEELADIYERTAQRDEILEQAQRDFKRITRDLGQLLQEKDPEVENAIGMLIEEAEQLAEEHGPGSEAALRYRLLLFLGWFAQQAHTHRRNPRAPFSWKVSLARDPSIEARNQATAAEVLDAPPPPGEAVIAIPPEDRDSGRRVFLRIGLGDASWIGSFEIGHVDVSTIVMMPDDKHLFVSAEGAGYIIDLKSRTLVEEIGPDVAGVTTDEPRTLFVVDHDGMKLEAFGKSGRLWKTDIISFKGFREIAITDTTITGEARHPARLGWTRFSVDLATGEVGFGDAILTIDPQITLMNTDESGRG